ncbi:protein LONGIFOLIA 1-like [Aristolochia californica]|uniref:protein LONGIFOLIA 1-like n=1 Tax=Aristolochia californica TaxID=171875 RepID=UPI0035DD90EA
MTACFVEEQRMTGKEMEKQMGCMAGFLNLFDRHQILAGKRLYTTKRLAQAVDSSSSSSGVSVGSPPVTPVKEEAPVGVEIMKSGPLESPKPKSSPLPLPIYEEGLKSSWKFREAPRLSLDSRVSGKGGVVPNANASSMFSAARSTEDMEGQRRAPSVIARLMGLEALPDSGHESSKKIELRRSASESRVSRDLLQAQYRFVLDGSSDFQPAKKSLSVVPENPNPRAEERATELTRKPKYDSVKRLTNSAWSSPQHRKSFFDTQDVFPEPVKRTGSLYGEIEKRFKMRGIDEQANDLETLKQILEALQLKGLLHSKRSNGQFERRNFILDRQFEEAPIVVMKPSRSPKNQMGKRGYVSPPLPSSPSNSKSRGGIRRTEATSPTARPMKRENQNSTIGRGRNSGNENPVKSPRRLSINVNAETQRKVRSSDEQRRVSSPKKIGPDVAISRSPRSRKTQQERISTVDEESSSLSESNASTYSQIDAESQRSKTEDYKEGRSLLERCDKLLHSIAEIAANDQPSPVSVLDSSFYKDEGSPPPISMKRGLDFIDEWPEMEYEQWSPASAISPIRTRSKEQSEDQDFLYVSQVLGAFSPQQSSSHTTNHKTESFDIFASLERKFHVHCKISQFTILHRRLLFDTVREILQRKQSVNSWKAYTGQVQKPSLRQVWAELRRTRENLRAEDICEMICGILGKDMATGGSDGWGDRSVEMSEAVLDIERLIFKDLVAETITELATFGPKRIAAVAPKRKLVF